MTKGPQGQKRPDRWLSALIVFGPVLFIVSAVLVDWARERIFRYCISLKFRAGLEFQPQRPAHLSLLNPPATWMAPTTAIPTYTKGIQGGALRFPVYK
jgi:hypothetical protein